LVFRLPAAAAAAAAVLFTGTDEKFAITEELTGLLSMKGHPISK